MLLGFLISVFCGIVSGTLTGLIPGIHINLVGAFLISLSRFQKINPLYSVVFISSMAITHTFIDFIPSVFLGCPDSDTELSVLPGHELLKKGRGFEAVMLTAYGSISAVVLLMLLAFPSILIISNTYFLFKKAIPFIIIAISVMLIIAEKKKTKSLLVFLLSGFLGLIVLNSGIKQPLLPLLTGLFGGSMILASIKNKVEIPEQKNPDKISPPIIKPLSGALISSPLCSFFPGLGSGQAAVIGNFFSRTGKKGFLVLLGATNTLVMGFSFLSLYTISRTRTGAASAIQKVVSIFDIRILILILTACVVSGIISFFLTKTLAKKISKRIHKINYSFISALTLVLLFVVVFLVSNFLGLVVLMASMLMGIYCISLGIKRMHMMGCLLIPVIFYYFNL